MPYRSISRHISLKKSQKETQCRYSGNYIEQGDIAFAVSSDRAFIRDRFIKLSNLRDFLSHIEHLYNNQEDYHSEEDISDSVPYWNIRYEEKPRIYNKTCAYCNEDLNRESVISFSVQQDDIEPAIHVNCIPILISDTENVLQNLRGEIAAQMI